MSTNYECVNRINTLKQNIEAVTGETYADLTEAAQGLKDSRGDIQEFLEGETSGEIDLSAFAELRIGVLSEFQNVTSVKLYKNLTKIPNYAFYKCSSLKNTKIPDLVREIGSYAFAECSSITDVQFSARWDVLHSIFEHAFKGTSITNLVIPKGVSALGQQAFAMCHSLTTVTFKDRSFVSLPDQLFCDCNNLTIINVPWSEGAVEDAPWGAVNATINYNYTEG